MSFRLQAQRNMPKRLLLILLDLNGTLLDRIDRHERKLAKLNPSLPKEPDARINQRHVYYRPFLDTLLQQCKSCHVGVWTSAIPMNADAMVSILFGKSKKSLEMYWNRRHCELVGVAREHASIKNLQEVWKDPLVNANGCWNEVCFPWRT
jgi:hypothetical protein